jgi:HlyD family secretion protein
MDRELSREQILRRQRKRIAQGGIIFIIVLVLFLLFRFWLRPVIHRSEIQTTFTDRGDIEATISASGTILPEFEEVISSPITSRILHIYHNVGETVKEGEIILSLDKKNEQLQLAKSLEDLASKENQKKKLQLSMERTLLDLQTNYEIQRLRTESLNTIFQNEKYIHSLGGTTQEMVKQAELNAKIAQLEIDHLHQSIANQKSSLQADLRDQEFIINNQKRDLDELKNRINNADVKATGVGVVTWINDKIGSTVSLGEGLVKLSNLQSFKAEGTVSDIQHNKLAVGRKVILEVNDSLLTGTISSINPTVQNDAVKFTVMPTDKSHPALRSNQKVDLYIVTSQRKKVVRLAKKNWINNSSNPYLFVIKGNKAIRKTVQFGESNFDYMEIKSGIAPGEEVIISDMADKMHLKEIKINE